MNKKYSAKYLIKWNLTDRPKRAIKQLLLRIRSVFSKPNNQDHLARYPEQSGGKVKVSKVIKNGAGAYFVSGSGFVGTEATATKFESCADAQSTIECLRLCGHKNAELVNAKATSNGSYAVCYIRPADILADGRIKSNKLNPSKRRFATEREAIQHGSRFSARRKRGTDKPGTAGHKGFYVIKTNDPVNAEVNWDTGLTNAK